MTMYRNTGALQPAVEIIFVSERNNHWNNIKIFIWGVCRMCCWCELHVSIIFLALITLPSVPWFPVFYPDPANITEDTTFGVYYFITGWGGFLYPHSYAEYLSRVASHGYVVMGSWPLVTGEGLGTANYSAEAHLENIEYVSNISTLCSIATTIAMTSFLGLLDLDVPC